MAAMHQSKQCLACRASVQPADVTFTGEGQGVFTFLASPHLKLGAKAKIRDTYHMTAQQRCSDVQLHNISARQAGQQRGAYERECTADEGAEAQGIRELPAVTQPMSTWLCDLDPVM